MKINQAFKYELKPNNKQVGLFVKHCGASRFAFNWALSRRQELYRTHEGKERFTTGNAQKREFNSLKKTEFPWMYEVSKSAPEAAITDLDRAYSKFGHKFNTSKRINLPKYKKKGGRYSFRLKDHIHVWPNVIRLPVIGKVRTKESTSKFRGKVLSATISREADRWYCSLCVTVERPDVVPVVGEVVGIDLGLNTFAVVYDGHGFEKIDAPKPLAKRLKKIQRLSRQQSRKHKRSRNCKKAAIALARCHRKVKNIRRDFINKLSTRLAKTKSVICIEDLNVSAMRRNRHLARSIEDVGWSRFKGQLEYKTVWYGSQLIKLPRFEPSSKKCHVCGTINRDLELKERTWICSNCSTEHDRDENSSINIRDYGINLLATESSSGSNACGVDVSLQQSEAIHDEARSKPILTNGKTCGTDEANEQEGLLVGV